VREERRTYWTKLISEQEASGATIQAFCKRRGIGVHSFYSWRRRLRKAEPAQFALLKTVATRGSQSPIELYLPGGERLCIANDVNVAMLRRVLDALRS
jgi:transposase-like protein